MQITIDSGEPLERVLPLINALYGVTLALPDSDATPAAAPRRARASKAAARQPAGRRSKRATATAGVVREWARTNGYEVSSRGRISSEVYDAYRVAH